MKIYDVICEKEYWYTQYTLVQIESGDVSKNILSQLNDACPGYRILLTGDNFPTTAGVLRELLQEDLNIILIPDVSRKAYQGFKKENIVVPFKDLWTYVPENNYYLNLEMNRTRSGFPEKFGSKGIVSVQDGKVITAPCPFRI